MLYPIELPLRGGIRTRSLRVRCSFSGIRLGAGLIELRRQGMGNTPAFSHSATAPDLHTGPAGFEPAVPVVPAQGLGIHVVPSAFAAHYLDVKNNRNDKVVGETFLLYR